MQIGSNGALFDAYGPERYRKMREFGFSYLDLSIDGELNGKTEDAFFDEVRQGVALAECDAVKVWQVHGPWRFPPHDETPEARAERSEVMRRSIRAAGMIGCRYWVIHPIMPFGWNVEPDADRFYDLNFSFFNNLLPTAKQEGVTICLENMPMTALSISSPEKTAAFVRQMGDEHFKLCLDTGHALICGVGPAEALMQVKDEVRVLHVHDNMGSSDAHLIPGAGVGDWHAFRDALTSIGFRGVYSLEAGWQNFLPRFSNDARMRALRALLDEIVPATSD